MSHKFFPWEPSKPSFIQDPTALEILNNYAKINSIPENTSGNKSKSTGRAGLNYIYESGGILVKPEFDSEYSFNIPDDGINLIFDSKFESGNLKKAIRMSDYEYKLFISSDTNTHRHNHWYYFSVLNPRKTSITFNIVNMLKFDDLYKTGLQPAVFSRKYFEKTGIKWHRDCTQVSYTKNNDSMLKNSSFTLSFSYDFRFEEDLVYFAYSIPYTYEELEQYLHYIKEKHHKIARISPMCKTVAGNLCEMITITENIRTYTSFEEEQRE